jgi:ABC-type polysaccharide/polyol phosphate export permease
VPVVYFFFKNVKFDWSSISIVAFCAILFSVVASWIWQNIETHYRSKKILPLISRGPFFYQDDIARGIQITCV